MRTINLHFPAAWIYKLSEYTHSWTRNVWFSIDLYSFVTFKAMILFMFWTGLGWINWQLPIEEWHAWRRVRLERCLYYTVFSRKIFLCISLYSACRYFSMNYNCHLVKRVSLPNRFWVKLLISTVWWWPTPPEIWKSEIQWKENISLVPGCGQTLMGEIELKGKECICFLAWPSNISIDLCQEGSRICSHDFTSLHGKRRKFSFKLKR